MENYGNTTSKNGNLQTKDSVLNQLIDYVGFPNLMRFGIAIVEIARKMYNQEIVFGKSTIKHNLRITSTGYLKDFTAADFGTTRYNNLVQYIQQSDDTGEYEDDWPSGRFMFPAFYPYHRRELVQLRLDSNDNICFMRGTDYYTLASTGMEVKHLDTLFT